MRRPALRFFRTVTAAEELPFPGGAYTIPPASLEPDITVYVEAANAAEVTLTLELARGGTAETKMLAVELTLDCGAAEIYAGATEGTRRRIAVKPVEPLSFNGRLTLRSASGGPALTLFPSENSTAGYALADGFSFDAPNGPASFWLQGAAVSKTTGDAQLELFVEGSQIAGDSCPVTVVSMTPVSAEIPGTPSKARRVPEVSPVELTSVNPLVLLAGAADSGNAARLRTTAAPAGIALRWTVSRAADDGAAIRE